MALDLRFNHDFTDEVESLRSDEGILTVSTSGRSNALALCTAGKPTSALLPSLRLGDRQRQ